MVGIIELLRLISNSLCNVRKNCRKVNFMSRNLQKIDFESRSVSIDYFIIPALVLVRFALNKLEKSDVRKFC